MPERETLALVVGRAPLDGHAVGIRRDVQSQRAGPADDARVARAEFGERIIAVIDLHRPSAAARAARLHARCRAGRSSSAARECRSRSRSLTVICLPCGVISFISRHAGGHLREPLLVRGLGQRRHRDRADGDVADFRRQRQLQPALLERAHQGAHAHAGLRSHAAVVEFQDLVERTGVDDGSAVAADAACLRIIGADRAYRRRIGAWVCRVSPGCLRRASGAS